MSVRSQRNMRDKLGIDSRLRPIFLHSISRYRVPISRQMFEHRSRMGYPAINSTARAEHTFARTTLAWDYNAAGVLVPYPINRDRWDDRYGRDRTCALIEGTRTNFLLNSTAPATQTTGSLGTGTYILWVRGTGTATITAGTGTASGLGAATAGTPVVFTVSVAGTFTVTVTGSLSFFQLEDGATMTSPILTAGATVQRTLDSLVWVPTATTAEGSGLLGSACTLVWQFRVPTTPPATVGANANIFSVDKNANDNDRISCYLVPGGAPVTLRTVLVAASVTNATIDHATAVNPGQFYKVAVAWDGTGASVAVTGKSTVQTGAGAPPTGLLAIRWGRVFGSANHIQGLTGLVQRINRRCTSAELLDLVRNV